VRTIDGMGRFVFLFPVRRWRLSVSLHHETAAARYTITKTVTAHYTALGSKFLYRSLRPGLPTSRTRKQGISSIVHSLETHSKFQRESSSSSSTRLQSNKLNWKPLEPTVCAWTHCCAADIQLLRRDHEVLQNAK
jgi:hypothetical protein